MSRAVLLSASAATARRSRLPSQRFAKVRARATRSNRTSGPVKPLVAGSVSLLVLCQLVVVHRSTTTAVTATLANVAEKINTHNIFSDTRRTRRHTKTSCSELHSSGTYNTAQRHFRARRRWKRKASPVYSQILDQLDATTVSASRVSC